MERAPEVLVLLGTGTVRETQQGASTCWQPPATPFRGVGGWVLQNLCCQLQPPQNQRRAPRGPQPGRQCPPAAAGPGRGDTRGARPHACHRDTEQGAGRGANLAKVLKSLRSVRGAPGVNEVAAFPL